MKNRDLIRDAMMFAVKDITGRVLREATVQSMIDDFEKQLNIPVVVGQREQLKAFLDYVDSRYSEQGTRDKIVDEFLSL